MMLRLLQWNIMYSEDLAQVAELIRDIAPDVACLQELTRGYHTGGAADAGAYLAGELGFEGYWNYGFMRLPDGSQAEMGCGVFARWPLSNGQKVILQEGVVDQGRVGRDERSYVTGWVSLPSGAKLKVGSFHLPFHPRFRTSAAKLAMAEQMQEGLPDAPYILAGDLNGSWRSKAGEVLRRSFKQAGPGLTQKTWTTKPFEIGPWSYEGLKWRLDYVMYRGELRPVRSRVIQTELSDHLPVLVEFEA